MEALEVLPKECWESIFSHLPDDGLKTVSLVCNDFLSISNTFKYDLKVVHPKIEMLSKQLKRFKSLRKIDLSLFNGDLDDAILEIAHSDIDLKILNISIQVEVKTESIKELGSNSKIRKNLKVLQCKDMVTLHDDNLLAIANSFPNLEELNLGDYRRREEWPYLMYINRTYLTEYGVESLTSLNFLKKINMSGFYDITDRMIVAFAKNCTFLKAITISIDHKGIITENGIGYLLRNSPNLEALKIGLIRMEDSSQLESAITIANSIRYAKALTSLKFFKMKVSDTLLNAIVMANLPLKKFELKECEEFTVTGLLSFLSESNYHLNELGIIKSNIVDVDMESILNGSNLVNLTHIDISQSRVTFSTLFLLSTNCRSLEEIRMEDTKLSEDDLPHYTIRVPQNTRIRSLDVSCCDVDYISIKQFGLMFPNLEVVDLSCCCCVHGRVIDCLLKNCKFVKKLILRKYRYSKMNETGKSKHKGLNLEEINLSGSIIDDRGLAGLADLCPPLVLLDLSYCGKYTIQGLKQIVRGIKTLNCLYIRGRNCSHLSGKLLDWMLSTGNLASVKKIYLGQDYNLNEEQRDQFLKHGCLILQW